MAPLRDEPSGPAQRAGRFLTAPRLSGWGSLAVAAVLLASLLFALVAYGNVLPGARSPHRSQPAGSEVEGVRLGGHAVGLYPGSVGRLHVYVENPGSHPVTVRSVSAEVGEARRRCGARNVSVSSYRGRLRVRPHRRRWVALTISMRPDAASACQRARFPLTYRARVSR